MAGREVSRVAGTASHGREDRLAVFERSEGLVLVVADGAGGTGHGAAAAEAVVAGVDAFGWSPEAARWAELLDRLDRSIAPGQARAASACATEIGLTAHRRGARRGCPIEPGEVCRRFRSSGRMTTCAVSSSAARSRAPGNSPAHA